MSAKKAADLGDIQVHEIGGIETHVHLAVSIEPTVTISEMVGALKGYASHEVNRRLGMASKALEWQTGYGVVSFGAKDLPWVVAYIQNQRSITPAPERMNGWRESRGLTIRRAEWGLKPERVSPMNGAVEFK